MEMTNEQIVAEIQAGNNIRAMEKLLIEQNINLVRRFAHAINIPGVLFEDREQDGCIGMLEAVHTYRPEKGVKFSTHASERIKAKIMREGTEQANMIHLPAHIVELRMKLNTVTREYMLQWGKRPKVEELAELTGKSVSDVKAAMDTSMPGSLDQTIESGDGDDMSIADIVGGRFLESEQWEDARTKAIVDFLDELPEMEQKLVIERLGLRDGISRTFRELEGHVFDENGVKISYVTIGKRYEKAIDYVRRRIAGEQIIYQRQAPKKPKRVKDDTKRDVVVVISQEAGTAFMTAELTYSQETMNDLRKLLAQNEKAVSVLENEDAVVLQYEQNVVLANLEPVLRQAMASIAQLKLELV